MTCSRRLLEAVGMPQLQLPPRPSARGWDSGARRRSSAGSSDPYVATTVTALCMALLVICVLDSRILQVVQPGPGPDLNWRVPKILLGMLLLGLGVWASRWLLYAAARLLDPQVPWSMHRALVGSEPGLTPTELMKTFRSSAYLGRLSLDEPLLAARLRAIVTDQLHHLHYAQGLLREDRGPLELSCGSQRRPTASPPCCGCTA